MSDWLASELDAAFAEGDGSKDGLVASGTFTDALDADFGALEEEKAEKNRAKVRRHRAKKKCDRKKFIAVLDFETDPFDGAVRERICPFAACLYSDNFPPVMIWEEEEEAFISAVMAAIEALPDAYTIYAHNGGRFDFMFLIHRLRGPVSFKGRGIMSAKIGEHELRDSFHIIPEALAAYKKDTFDYDKMHKTKRYRYKQDIQAYLLSDCAYLFDIVRAFVDNYGLKISIGQAAMHLLKKDYPDCESLNERDDAFIRNFFFGGRVECIAGAGEFIGDYELHDVNSMYPDVMANCQHPIGNRYIPRKGQPNRYTCFIDLNCYSDAAFPIKREGSGTCFPREFGRYRVSIHEYNMALALGLISRIEINYCVDNTMQTDFSKFILPLYEAKARLKEQLDDLAARGITSGNEYDDLKKDYTFSKLLQNNAYGKFAQNPRNFKEHYLTDPDGVPEDELESWGLFPSELCDGYSIWSRPTQTLRFNNVGTAASITGAARAKLLEARALAIDPIYCDTDSLICRKLVGVDQHKSRLGAWDCEAKLKHVMIAGRKLYAYETSDGRQKIKSKGVRNLKWDDMRSLVAGGEITISAFAPTLTRRGEQRYIDRTIRATAIAKG